MIAMPALAAVGAVLGLISGSFINVVAHRVPRGESVVRPPSACPVCAAPIRGRDNVPVVSWIRLRGRCRDCRGPISVRYPLVEAGTAAAFAGVALLIGPRAVLPAYWWAAGVAITLALTDVDVRRIPNRILYPGTAVGLVLLGVGSWIDATPAALLRAVAGGAIYFGLLAAIAIAARGGFGFGDVKLAFLLGLYLGHRSWAALAVGVFAAFLVGGVVAVGLLAARRARRGDAIAFGPAMIAAAFLAAAVGERIADWYLG